MCAGTIVAGFIFAVPIIILLVPFEVFLGFMAHAILEEGITAPEKIPQTCLLAQPANATLAVQ